MEAIVGALTRRNVLISSLVLTWGCSGAPNLRPVSVAGPDILVDSPGIDAQMDGSASEDYDGAIVSFAWSLVSAPSNSQAQLESKDTPFPWLIPDVDGTYVVSLVVTDDQGLQSAPDILSIATPQYPIETRPMAELFVTGDVGVGATLTLDGSGSTDAEGDPLNFEFTLQAAPQGSSAQIDHQEGPVGFLTPDVAGAWIVGLTVSDESINPPV